MQGPPMDLKSQISAIINESERGQTLEQVAEKLAERMLPTIKSILDDLSEQGAIGKNVGASIYLTTYHRAKIERRI
jgi:hypothetical protein